MNFKNSGFKNDNKKIRCEIHHRKFSLSIATNMFKYFLKIYLLISTYSDYSFKID